MNKNIRCFLSNLFILSLCIILSPSHTSAITLTDEDLKEGANNPVLVENSQQSETTSSLDSNGNTNGISTTFPGKNWALNINVNGLVIKEDEMSKSGTGRRILAVNPDNEIMMTVFLEKAPKVGGSKECRDYYYSLGKQSGEDSDVKRDDETLWEQDDKALLSFLIKSYNGVDINQKNLNIYMEKDDIWIDIHVSKPNYQGSDEGLFDQIINNTKIVNIENITENDKNQSAEDSFNLGNDYYQKNDFNRSSYYYQKALDSEKTNPTFTTNKEKWYLLVDNLSRTYGMSGNLEKAKETIDYGISVEPQYFSFYYSLACYYAEKNDLENILINLKKAYDLYTANPIGAFPDPMNDGAFSKFITEKKFQELVSSFK